MFGPWIDGPLLGLSGLAIATLFCWNRVRELLRGGLRSIAGAALACISAAGSGLGIYAYQMDSNSGFAAIMGLLFGSFIVLALLQDTWLKKAPFIALSIISGTILTSAALLNPITQGARNADAGKEVAALTLGSASALKDSLTNAQRAEQGFIDDAAKARARIAEVEASLKEDRVGQKIASQITWLNGLLIEPAAGTVEHTAWRARIRQFQRERTLTVDGFLGGQTRAAIAQAKLQAQKRYDREVTALEAQKTAATARLSTALARQQKAAGNVAEIQRQMREATSTAIAATDTQTNRVFVGAIAGQWEYFFSLMPFQDRRDSVTAFAFLIMSLVDLGANWLLMQHRPSNDNRKPEAPRAADEPRPAPLDAMKKGVAALTNAMPKKVALGKKVRLSPGLQKPAHPVVATASPPAPSTLSEIGKFAQAQERLRALSGDRKPEARGAAKRRRRA